MTDATRVSWILLVVKLPTRPTRHRVAVWRELRKVGALSVGQGVWAVPDVPAFATGLSRVAELTSRADGEIISLQATGSTEDDAVRFEAMFNEAREADWAEFLSDCGKYEAEIDKEIRIGKFTLAELEEEEQSLDRLRRWHRDLRARDMFGAANAPEARTRLDHCVTRFEDYAEQVMTALHAMPDESETH